MIKFSDYSKHVYTYDASGRKLRAEYHVPVVVAAEPQVLQEEVLLPIEMLEQPFEEQPEELQMAEDTEQVPAEQPLDWEQELIHEWEEPWQEFEQTMEPFICIMPPQPPDDEIVIDEPIWDEQPVIDEVPCDVTAIDYCGNFSENPKKQK